MNVEGYFREIRKPLLLALIAAAEIQESFTRSHLLKARGVEFFEVETDVWELKYKGAGSRVTFVKEKLENNRITDERTVKIVHAMFSAIKKSTD